MMIERHAVPFQEFLSRFMVRVAAAGAAWVLMDPRMTIAPDGSVAFVMNSGAFSNDLKGAVISAILIGGFTSVREYWLGSSKAGQEQAQSMSRIAEAAPSVAAAAVAAAAIPAGKADTVNVDATGGNVNIEGQPQEPKP